MVMNSASLLPFILSDLWKWVGGEGNVLFSFESIFGGTHLIPIYLHIMT